MNERDAILAYADAQYPVYRQMALDIHARPETSNHEYCSVTIDVRLEGKEKGERVC